MANTGYLVTVEQDINPYSPTYLQTRESEEYNTDACALDTPTWEYQSEYCETDPNINFGNTGYLITVEINSNPSSSSYLQTRETKSLDITKCPIPDTSAGWYLDKEYCETKVFPNGKTDNTGVYVEEYIDANEYSPTYNTTKIEKRVDGTICPAPNQEPDWFNVSEICNVVIIEGDSYTDGTMKIVQIDRNGYSDTYNTYRDVIEEDAKCPKQFGKIKFVGNINNFTEIDSINPDWFNYFDIDDNTFNKNYLIPMDKNNINTYLMDYIKNHKYTITKNILIEGTDNTYRDTVFISSDGVSFTEHTLPITLTLAGTEDVIIGAYKN